MDGIFYNKNRYAMQESRTDSGIMQAIEDRRSIRRFEQTKVPRKSVEEILKAGILAPSSKNRQPWKFIVAEGTARTEACNAMEKGLEREKTNPLLPGSAEYLQGAWQSLAIMRQAPVIIFVINMLGVPMGKTPTLEERISEICNVQSIGAAMENMSLAAGAQSLGTLWICNTFFAWRELEKWLDAGGVLCAAMAVEYAGETPPARPRKALEEVVRWME